MSNISNQTSVFFTPDIPKPEDLGPPTNNIPKESPSPEQTRKKNQLKWHLTVLLKTCNRPDFRSLLRALNPKASVTHVVDALKHITALDVADANMTCDHLWGSEARPSEGQRT